MALAPGTRHGSYEIIGQLGEGGMGVVYRARDTKLGRDVAIKVISDALAEDPERLARFEREARALAALNHPSIAAIYGLEEADGRPAIVMELVEGPTLADLIREAPVPVAEALRIARQIADALEAAHETAIIHRDLKPANVKVRPDGTVKLLDFGLAKALEADGVRRRGSSPSASMPTITSPARTGIGVILGTAAYMSPEQAKGGEVDERGDVWAFGCVLYEMLSGRRAFDAKTVPETLAAVLRADVDWSALPPGLSPMAREFLVRCLHRDPRQRLHAIADMRLALEGAFDGVVAEPGEKPARRSAWRRALPVAVAMAATAVVVGVSTWSLVPTAGAPVVSRLQMLVPPGDTFYYSGRHLVAISPDGTHVAYSAGAGLYLHRLDELEARPVPGAELEGRSPFFSPDGQSIGYFAAGQLRRVPVNGGAPVALGPIVNPWGASWNADGMIYYGQGPDGVWKMPADGGQAEQIITVREGEMAHGPHLLPDGEWMLFTLLPDAVGSWNRAQVVLESLTTHDRIVLVNGGRDARYLPTGHLVYGLNGVLFAAPFDPVTRRLTGNAVAVVRDVFDAGTVTGAVHFDVAANGSLIYVPRIGPALRLVWVDRNGTEEVIPADPRPYRHARVSPDGSRIAVEVEEPANTDIWIGEAGRGTFARLTTDDDVDSDPIWTRDGSRVVFTSVRTASGLFWQAADGSGTADHLTDATGGVRAFAWTSDGRLLYEELAGAEVRLLAPDGTPPQVITLFDAPEYFNEVLPALSPDGKWLAYQSSESGRIEIYVRPFPDVASGRWRISDGEGQAPLWSPDGREIFYRTATSLMAVPVKTSPVFAAGAPKPILALGGYVMPGIRGIKYDVAPDGRFLLLKDESGVSSSQERLIVVQHWFEELRGLVGAR